MSLEFHPDNPKLKLQMVSFLLDAGVMENVALTPDNIDVFNEAVRELAANITAGYQNYLDDCYKLAKKRDKEREKLCIASVSRRPD